jgi:hypothetical protein
MKSRFYSIIKVVVLIVAVFASGLSTAQSIFSNAITGNNPSNQDPYATNQVLATGVTSTGIGQGGGLNNSNSTNTYNANSWSTNGTLNTGNNEYFDWTITPTGCNEIDFASLILFYQRTTSGPQNIALRSSLDNYATNIWTTTFTVIVEQSATIDLSAIAFQNITTPITFRLYGWNSTSTNGNFSINSFDFQGAVVAAIPSEAGVVTGSTSVCPGTANILNVTGGVGNIQWQSSANNVTFANIAGATAATYNTTSLIDTYFRTVFTNGSCSSVNSSSFFVDVLQNTLTALEDSSCAPAALTIGVAQSCPSALNTINWYDASTGGISLGLGSTFTTPVLTNTTTYFASANFTAGATLATGNRSATLQRGLIFDAYETFLLNSFQINTNAAGAITLELRDNLNQPVPGANAIVFNAVAGTNTVPLGWTIPAGTGYRIIKTAGTIQLSRTDPFTFPIAANGVLSITSSVDNGAIENTRYFYFYNWNVSTARIPVTATIGVGSVNSNVAISACDSYTWATSGETYFASGVYTFSTACSVDTLDLTINPSAINTTVISACDSYTWSVNGTTYTESGNYSLVNNCNTEILVLTITPSTTNTTIASSCDAYVWPVDGQQYTESGTYTYQVDCVTEILELTIVPSTTNFTVASECDVYTWSVNGQEYTTSGTYFYEVDCHTEILELTIAPSTTNTTAVNSCDVYTWSVNGQDYSASGTYTFVSGCVTEILELTITPSTNNTTTASACNSYTWSVNGITYAASGTYTSVSGCNTETLVLTITPASNNSTSMSACDTYTWPVNGVTYTASGTYTFTSACQTETLNLTIQTSSLYFVDADLDGFGSTVSQLACAGATGYSLNSSDCNDSNASVNPSETEICNTIDDNCNSQTDEGLLAVFFVDNDGDTFGNPSATTLACSQPAGYASNDADCNDTEASINPAAVEVVGNNVDENCDGQIDISVFELNSNIALYPNPTQSELNIQVNSSIIGSDLFIFDAVGNLVYSQKILSTQSAISVSNLANGNYNARVGEMVKRFEVIK